MNMNEFVDINPDNIVECLKYPDELSKVLEEPLEPKKALFNSRDPKRRLRDYKIFIENGVCWEFRQKNFKLIKRFLNEEIGGKKFVSEFMNIRSQKMRRTKDLCQKIEEDRKLISEFYYTSKSVDLQSALNNLFFDIDYYYPDVDDSEENNYIHSTRKLRSIVKEKTFPIFQNCCDPENQLLVTKNPPNVNSVVQQTYTLLLLTSVILLINLSSFILSW